MRDQKVTEAMRYRRAESGIDIRLHNVWQLDAFHRRVSNYYKFQDKGRGGGGKSIGSCTIVCPSFFMRSGTPRPSLPLDGEGRPQNIDRSS
jgi:hypothetical protein